MARPRMSEESALLVESVMVRFCSCAEKEFDRTVAAACEGWSGSADAPRGSQAMMGKIVAAKAVRDQAMKALEEYRVFAMTQ